MWFPISNYQLKFKAAKYYYEKDLTQQEIADKMNVSRPTVSNLLSQAREEGIVKIEIEDIRKDGQLIEAEKKIEDLYGLDEVKIAKCQSQAALLDCIGQKAAEYFDRVVEHQMKVGVSWGRTLSSMMKHLPGRREDMELEVVTLAGGSGDSSSEVHCNILADKIIENYGGAGYYLYAPVIVDNEDVCRALLSNQETQKILEKAKNVDLAIVGIGSPIESSNLLKTGYFQEEEVKEVRKKGAIGDICSRFFDEEGNSCDLSINRRAIGITLDDLRKINCVVGVAGGKEKIESIKAAMLGDYIDVLITDAITAENI